MSATRIWAVILVDVVASRDISEFTDKRTKLLAKLSSRQRRAGLLHTPYAVSAYDEFQALAAHPRSLPRLVWELRRDFHPWRLRIGMGLGAIDAPPEGRQPLNKTSTGEAFYRAREALDWLDHQSSKFERWTRMECADESVRIAVNLAYGLLDTLLDQVTPTQWQTVQEFQRHRSLAPTAAALGVDPSTVSRSLQRGSYWQARETMSALTQLLNLHYSVQSSEIAHGDANRP